MALSDILQYYCYCCYNPIVHQDEENIVTYANVPTVPRAANFVSEEATTAQQTAKPSTERVITAADEIDVHPLPKDVDQSEVFPVSWRDTHRESIDLKDIPEVEAVVAKPESVDQPEVHPVSWSTVSKGSKAWGGEGLPAALEETDQQEEDASKSLPLPWEGKLTPVPFDGKTTGPSWEQVQTTTNTTTTTNNHDSSN